MLSGQFGSAMGRLAYESTSNTFSTGFTYKPSKKVEMSFDGVWNDADAALETFDVVVPAEFLAANPNMSYDFTATYLNSDLDVSRLELGVHGRFDVAERFGIVAGYRYLHFADDTPYRYDTSGSLSLYSLGVGWSF